MKLLSTDSYLAGRLLLFGVALFLPLGVTAWAYGITRNRGQAFLSGFLAVFSAFYLPFITHTDSFALVMLLGLIFFVCIERLERQMRRDKMMILAAGLGLCAGLMHLSRADGLLWLVAGLIYLFWRWKRDEHQKSIRLLAGMLAAACLGYLVVMGPWFWRNTHSFGTPLAPGNIKTLWLNSYDELYVFPANTLTAQRWLAAGWGAILRDRLWALGLNLQTVLLVQGEIFLLPFIFLGLRSLWNEKFVQVGSALWLCLLFVMTVTFPFAGARGGFFHSGAALQPLFWVVTPVGLDCVLDWVSKVRRWRVNQARQFFQPALVGLAFLLSLLLLLGIPRSQREGLRSWGETHQQFLRVEQAVRQLGAGQRDVVMVNNPPGYYVAARRPAVAVPFGDVQVLLAAARRYQVKYLLLEFNQLQGEINVYEYPHAVPELRYLEKIGDVQMYEIVLGEN